MINSMSASKMRGRLLDLSSLTHRCTVLTGLVLLMSTVADPVAAQSANDLLVLSGGRVIWSPDEPAIDDAVVIIEEGRILELGPSNRLTIPAGANTIDCTGLVLVAGFQNNHVHFTEDKWLDAGSQSAQTLTQHFQNMLTRYGYTTVVDTASPLENTVELRRRVEAGEVDGPRILTAGLPLYPPGGIPYYIRETVPAEVLQLLPQPASGSAAAEVVRRNFSGGADLTKLFTGSWISRQQVVPMPAEIVAAAVAETHQDNKLVFTHPSNVEGLQIALDADVDVLAHAIDDVRGLTHEHLEKMLESGMALIPTLMVIARDGRPEVLEQVGNYQEIGGQILFGTDVGFVTDYDPALEYELMEAAGLTWREILASLTTNPANRFNEADERGILAEGMDADITILGTEPSAGPHAFTDVRYTIRAGHVIYKKP